MVECREFNPEKLTEFKEMLEGKDGVTSFEMAMLGLIYSYEMVIGQRDALRADIADLYTEWC